MSTVVTQSPAAPEQSPLRPVLLLAAGFAAVKFLIHLLSSIWGIHYGYGFFRDEFYFLMCGRRLAWGYVDQPPMVALQARVAETIFGVSPTGIRVFSFAAGGVMVGLTGMLAWQLGGARRAQILAMTAVLVAPVFLGTSSYLSMNSFEPCFWMGSLFILMRIAQGQASERAWLLFGLLAGLGIENKHSTVFFLAALLVGLLATPRRRILASWWCAAGVALIVLLALPNFLWQWAHHFPTQEFLNNVEHSDKNVRLSPPFFLLEQVNILLFSSAPLWIGGACWLGFSRAGRPWRFAGIAYAVFLASMMTLHAKDYYVAPIYPVLYAAGAVWFCARFPKAWHFKAYVGALVFALVIGTGPIALTLLPPNVHVFYAAYSGARQSRSEKFTSPLPQILSDRFGWPQMVEGFAARLNALPPAARAHTAIFCDNYGEASAVDILGPAYGLPPAISPHQNYFYWGWHGYDGESVLTLGDRREDYTADFGEVIDLGRFDVPWTMDFEHRHYFWLRHRKRSFAQDWPKLKFWY
jgi:hypothetical protein